MISIIGWALCTIGRHKSDGKRYSSRLSMTIKRRNTSYSVCQRCLVSFDYKEERHDSSRN